MTLDQTPDSGERDYENEFYSTPVYRHYAQISKNHLEKNPLCSQISENIKPLLTGHVLSGPSRIGLRSPSFFIVDDKFLAEFKDMEVQPGENNHSYTFMHFGSDLSGHPKIVHGGLLATVLDELTCRIGFQNCAPKKGVTANLNLHYHKPCHTDSYVMVKCRVMKKERRKCWVKGEVFVVDLETDPKSAESAENLLTSCECLIIEPRPTA